MNPRTVLLALAATTVPYQAQIMAGATASDGAVEMQAATGGPAGAPGGVIMAAPGTPGAAAGGELDFNRLRQLIEESKKRPAATPEQQKVAILRELKLDRSPTGILAVRLEEARMKEAPATPVPARETPEQAVQRFQQEAQVFRRDVVLGRWDRVRDFMAALPKEVSAESYQVVWA